MCLTGLLCCLCGPGACGLCCCKGKVKSSITTRLLYFAFLLVVLVVTSIMLSPTVANRLQKAAILCVPFNKTIPHTRSFIPRIHVSNLLQCNEIVGYLAAYRVCIAVASFFLLMSVIMICVRSSKDPRAYLQNGFWFFKWLFVIGLAVAFFFIPDGSNLIFSRVTVAIGLMGSVLFIVFQIIFLVDFAHCWAENWIGRAEENDNKWWYVLMLVFSVIFYVGSLVGIILLYVFFTETSSCSLNKFFISSILILGVIVSVVAILPWVQRVQPKSGLLQASIVTAYCTYITWSAVSTEPYGIVNSNSSQLYNCHRQNSSLAVYGHGESSSTAASVVGIALLFLTVAYMCFSLSGHRQIRKLRGKKENGEDDDEGLLNERVYVTNDSDGSDDDENNDSRWSMDHKDDEKEAVTYSYTFFHFMMMLAVLFFMMQLTNWADPGSADSEHFKSTWAATWVQIVSAWVCFGVYLWTLVAPLVLGNCRDFE